MEKLSSEDRARTAATHQKYQLRQLVDTQADVFLRAVNTGEDEDIAYLLGVSECSRFPELERCSLREGGPYVSLDMLCEDPELYGLLAAAMIIAAQT